MYIVEITTFVGKTFSVGVWESVNEAVEKAKFHYPGNKEYNVKKV